jgi:hypothetical protein
MTTKISLDYLTAHAALPHVTRLRAEELLRRLVEDPVEVLHHRAPPSGGVPRLRALRIDGDHRLVVSESEDARVVLWAGPRLEAARRISSPRFRAQTPGADSAEAAVKVEDGAEAAVKVEGGAPDDPGGIPLATLPLPMRMRRYAARKRLRTLGELAHLDPRRLLREPQLGRRTLADVRLLIEERWGARWEQIASPALPRPSGEVQPGYVPEIPQTIRNWEDLRLRLPAELRATPLVDLRLPTRLGRYAAREGMRTLGDLAARSTEELLAARNIGRTSVRTLFEMVRAHQDQPAGLANLVGAGLLEALRTLLSGLRERHRRLVIARAGLEGPAMRGEALAQLVGIQHPANLRRVELQALEELKRNRLWLGGLRERALAGLAEGAALLSDLARDPWWSGIVAWPGALDYAGEHVLSGAFRVVDLGGVLCCTRSAPEDVEAAWRALITGAAGVALPAPISAFRALLDPWAARLGAVLVEGLVDRLRRERLIEDARVPDSVLGYGISRRVAVGVAALALVRSSPTPMSIAEVKARTGGMTRRGVLFFGRGVIGTERHFPDFDAWRARLLPVAVRVLRGGPGRQKWHARDVYEAMAKTTPLPAWMTFWHIGSLLLGSDDAGE